VKLEGTTYMLDVATPPLTVLRLGRTDYRAALAVQHDLHERRKAGRCADTLILTEHEPVLTLGRGADTRHLRVSVSELSVRGMAIIPVERGGDITYHGPGQLIAYPILDLRGRGRDIHRYVRALEESAVRLLAGYGVAGERRPGAPGVWAGADKIASVGIFVSRWVTLHGIAVNIDPNLAHFDLIHPCGLVGTRMTSLAAQLGRPVALAEAEERYITAFTTAMAALMERPSPPDPLAGG
jgi:lipoate-protein ligase B